MRNSLQHLPFVAALLAAAPGARAQQPTLPPVRPIGPVVAHLAETVASITGLRVLSDGRLLLDDPLEKQVLLVDSSLQHAQHVIDTLGTTGRFYPRRAGELLPFVADSSLYLDPIALGFLVISPNGTIGRVISAPVTIVTDRDGPIRYLGNDRIAVAQWITHDDPTPDGSTASSLIPIPDTGMIVRADLVTHHVDTVAFYNVPRTYPMVLTTDSTGKVWRTRTANPVPIADDWGFLPDGTIAIARGQDFHIDWIRADGALQASPKLAHQWVRLTDSAKAAILDSAKLFYADPRHQYQQSSSSNGVQRSRTYAPNLPAADDLPDYEPPFADVQGADADGNLWIREFSSLASAAGPIYDVITRAGQVIDRVQTPGGTSLQGWGPGVVYLTSRDGLKTSLVRARVH